MSETRVKIQSIVENQLPEFVAEENPLLVDFLKQYYISQEYPGAASDLIQNIDKNIKLDEIFNSVNSCLLAEDVDYGDKTIRVSTSTDKEGNILLGTKGFPDRYGLIKIDDEIITYTHKTDNTFEGCVRGFSGVTSYTKPNNPEELVFSNSNIAKHTLETFKGAPTGPIVYNLSILFLNQFLNKLKHQFLPGFAERTLDSDLNENLFIKQSKDFYSSKGTDRSFVILFGALYGEKVEVIKPRDYLFRPSDAGWRRTKDVVVEKVSGDPLHLLNNTLYQDADEKYGITEAYGSVTDVEKVSIGNTEYYKLSFDSDFSKDSVLQGGVYGSFTNHAKTLVITPVSIGSSVIDVDSTVGFAHSGELIVNYDGGTTGIVSYSSKSITQFFGIAGTAVAVAIGTASPVRVNAEAYGYGGIGVTNPVKVRIGAVLDEVVIPEKTYFFSKGDTAKIKTLGISSHTVRRDNWIGNIANTFDVDSFKLIDVSDYTYEITTYDKHNFRIGDSGQVTENDVVKKDCEITNVASDYIFSIKGQGQLFSGSTYTIQRKLLKVESTVYPYLNKYNANIQNTYTNYSNELLVASPSLPFYNDQYIDPYSRRLTLSGSYSGTLINVLANDPDAPEDHGFYTGDRIYYKPYVVESSYVDNDGFTRTDTSTSKFPELDEGLYFVNRVNSSSLNLAKSPSNLASGDYISVSGIVTSNSLIDYSFANKEIEAQNILKEIKTPVNRSKNYPTEPGKTGVMVNGVEILNYKSADTLYYGIIEDIEVDAPGTDYDIINPPSLDITDSTGIAATGICAVKGTLDRIEVINGGFDYVDSPFITISGGNGKGGAADVNLRSIEHSVTFDTTNQGSSGDVFIQAGSATTSLIGFSTYHKFRDYEKVVYKTNKQTALSGLTTDASYHVSVVNASTIRLHKREQDAISGINTVYISDYGVGTQQIKSSIKKNIISDITLVDGGEGYENKKRTAKTTGISTALDRININSHGYQTGETLTYATTGNAIEGLNTSLEYLVKRVNADSFKLAPVGLGTTSKTEYLDSEQYIDLKSIGSGVHSFNYPTISVTVTGSIGVSTLANQNFHAQLQPIFRGSIESVHLTDKGSKYGSDSIINYNRQPVFTLRSGKNAETTVIASNGQIQEVLVNKGGSGYNTPPTLTLKGNGNYAKLTPVVESGVLKKVNVIYGGSGYDNSTTLDIEAAGKDCKLRANIQRWTVNLFQKYLKTFTPDDGVIALSDRNNYGLEYCHLYAPRRLRESVYVRDAEGDIQYGVPDLITLNNQEQSSKFHSPIIGYAYDGNPIYGPYGYNTPEGGIARAMESGYEAVAKANRPPLSNFPQGFFNEDFAFKNSGDLDEHNGRFAITPEFPNGVYAYYTTINRGNTDTDGSFKNYFQPEFPYVIGTCFYSEPIAFNSSDSANQQDYDLNTHDWFRNSLNYKFKLSNSSYDFVKDPDRIKNQTVNIDYTSDGGVQTVGIITGGKNYNIGDRVLFNNSLTGGVNASAKVDRLFGKNLTALSVATTSFSSVEFATLDGIGNIVGFTTSPHGLKNGELMSISGLSSAFAHLDTKDSYYLGIRTDNFVTTLGIGSTNTTGLTTYFYTTGFLDFPYIRENDILGIGNTEKVKVLNIDKIGKRIRVRRAVDGTVGFAYSASTLLKENPRKFTVNTGLKTDYSYSANREIYFDPNESVGIGTSAIAGIGSTATFSMPGIGATQLFVPYSQIYVPNHGLKTGDKVRYSTHGGTGIGCWHPITGITSGTTFALPEGQDLYIANFARDYIGISTVKVGLGTTGVFVGVGSTTTQRLPYFKNFGIGDYHSFTTKKDLVISGEIGQNIVTVSTASTHGLSLGDNVQFTALPKDTETITVKYNDSNRRAVFKPQTWVAGSVDTSKDTITISNHGLSKGDKVVYTSSTPSGGLLNEGIYYVLPYTSSKIRLCATRYDLNLNIPNYINITSAKAGTISLINPQLDIYKNKVVKFNLSDSSLASKIGLTTYSAFALNFYTDPNFEFEFESTGTSSDFEVVKAGTVGLSGDAAVSIFLNDNVPENLYYKLDLVNEDLIADVKKEIIIDTDVFNYNQINLVDSKYTGSHRVIGLGTTTFKFNIPNYPEASSYSSSTANLYYTTKSSTAYGAINSVEVLNSGKGYEYTPGVSTISSAYGKDAILEIDSLSIGQIEKTTIEDIGFDYPTDYTLSPSLNLPEILTMEPLTSFNRIGITSGGKNYLTDPDLVVLDGYTGKVVDDVILDYKVGSTQVKILQNTYGMHNVLPTIIPTKNSNGIGINTITYSTSSPGIVTAGINTGFSDIFPIAVGDKVFIENTSVGVGSTSKGYNSDAYNYKLFSVTAVDENLGGSKGSVTYDMSPVLDTNEYPGIYNPSSFGRIIPQKDFPIFDIQLQSNDYFIGEKVASPSGEGIVETWNNKVENLKVRSSSDFKVGDIVTGETSRTKGVVKKKIDFDSYIKLGSTSNVNKGWIYDTGILNNNVQRLPDNNYYQYFSYSLKSKIPYETWDEPVNSLNHASGFLKFSDLIIESEAVGSVGIATTSTNIDITADLEGEGDINCVYTFDLASEETSVLGTALVSNEIVFQNRVLSDYYESVGNRVLLIDDFSDSFNHKPRSTPFSIINADRLNVTRARKFFTYVRDSRYTQERQVIVVALLHDGVNGFLNQYGRVETHPDLGSFDWNVSGTEGRLLFYPIKSKYNNYDVTYVAHDLNPFTTGIGSTALGSIVHINSHHTAISNGSSSATTIVGIASTYRSSKVIVEIGADDGSYYEFDELNLIHDGSTVDMVEYGQLSDNNLSPYSVGGLGTYYSYIDGSRIKIDFTPDSAVGVAHSVSALSVSIASSTSTATGVGTATELSTGLLDSWYTSIAASGTPGINTIAEYHADSHGAYYVVQLEDTTNKRYEMCEVIACDDGDYNALTEYGNVQLHTTGIGTIGANIDGSSRKHLTFIPNHNIKVQVRVFQNVLSLVKDDVDNTTIDLQTGSINSAYGSYRGTHSDIKRTFGLLHNEEPIFQRFVNGSDTTVINLSADTITIPDHYFVSGEKLTYSYAGSGTTQAIGIGTSTITGYGSTTKLPATVYAVKVDENKIRLAASATNALLTTPEVLDINAVGVGTSHSFTSHNQNAKAIIAIDNVIQSPIVGGAVTTTLAKNVALLDEKITFSGITSFFSGDLVQINTEIMKINTVGLGSTNIMLVDREWMGTGRDTHTAGTLIEIIEGNYNIRENKIHFVSAPYGSEPISSTTNAPDDRDWTGISTHSTFQGRTFMRSGKTNTAAETYANNIVFDDISNEFTGIAKTFTLTKDGGTNATGFSTSNGIILINSIFQGPEGIQSDEEDYEMKESAGISSIFFTGTASSVTYDVNNANIPTGGVIVSVGSTEGFGFQPLVAAGGTAVVSAAGTIQSVGMGTSGSGYRLGIQTTVNVAIQTSSLYSANYVAIGTAQIVNGGITGIAITNPHVFYAPVDVSNVGYSSVSGVATVTTHQAHGLQVGEAVKLSGIAFTCDYAAPISISTAAYTSSSGIMTVTTSSAHGFNATGKSSVVIFTGLGMTCAIDSGVTTHYYPRGKDPAYNSAVSVASTSTTQITVNVGVAGPGDQYAHTFKRAATNAIVSGGDYLHNFVSGVTSCVISGGNYLHTFDSVGVTSITVTGIGSITPTNATYNPLTGNLVLTVGSGHTYTTDDTVGIGTSALVFTCALDDDGTEHSYPRATDPVIGVNTAITAITDSTITVNVGTSKSVFFDVYDAQYTGSTGIMTLNIGSHGLTTGTSIRLMNNGLSFRCAMDDYKSIHTYPRSTDTYYDTAISIAATAANTISLNVGISSLKYDDVSAATYDPATGDLVLTVGAGHSISKGVSVAISTESLTFTCARDNNSTEHKYPRKPDPTYAGVPIQSVGTTTTFVVNVGTSTVPTFYQGGGVVQAAIIAPRSINNSSSKEDPASFPTPILPGVTTNTFMVNTGVSTRTHFYARGGKVEKNLIVKFDDPLSYSNIPLIYSSDSQGGIGTHAKIDVVVGQGSSVIDFTVSNTGYGFGQGEILTVNVGGSAGIPTDTSLTYKEFQITIEDIYSDAFAGWSIGDLQVLDNFDSLCDGSNRTFPIKYNDQYLTIRAAKGSNIDIKSTLLVFVNDVLQVPGEAYIFNGGSSFKFTEAPKKGDSTKILYYKGTGAVDVVFKDVLETVKVGDKLELRNESKLDQGPGLLQDPRVVTGINTTDSVETNPYAGPGITTDDTLVRPVKWCRQTEDKVVDGIRIGKDREHYEPLLQPTSYLIQNVGVGSTCAWVQNAKPFFDPINEDNTDTNTYTVEIISQDTKTAAAATVNISTAGTVSSFTISNAGYGYTSVPTVTVGTPVGIGTTPGDNQAYATATLSSGTVSAITIGSTPGSGYTSTNPPVALIAEPASGRGKASSVTYQGDFGIISGIKSTSVGVASTGIVFDLFIPPDSELRDSNIVGVTTVSGIATGYYFTVSNSTVGNGVTSLYQNNTTLGIGSTFIDNVYEVAAVSIGVTAAESKTGAGLTAVAHVTVSVANLEGLTGLGYSSYYGNFSWGKILFGTRTEPQSYNAYTNDGITGISTGGIVRRLYPLKWKNYS